MQRNPTSIITKTEQYQAQDITFAQVKWKFVSPVQTGVKFCAIKKPSCVMDGHFITNHRRLCPTAFFLDNLRKTYTILWAWKLTLLIRHEFHRLRCISYPQYITDLQVFFSYLEMDLLFCLQITSGAHAETSRWLLLSWEVNWHQFTDLCIYS